MAKIEQQWLVKSGTYILGPFSSESVVEQLLDKRLSPRDEISGHMKNWISISDEPTFATTVEEIRILSFSEEHTNSQTFVNFTATEGDLSGTDPSISAQIVEDKDDTHVERRASATLQGEALYENSNKASVPPGAVGGAYVPPRGGGSLKTFFNWTAVFAIVFGAGFLFYHNSELSMNGQKKVKSKELLERGLRTYRLGRVNSSYKDISAAVDLNPENHKAYQPLVELLIYKKESKKARKLLNKPELEIIKDYEKFNLMGLSYLAEDNYVLAEKYLNKALAENKEYTPAIINSGLSLMGNKKMDMAELRFKQGTDRLKRYPHVGLLFVKTHMELGKDNNQEDDKVLADAIAFLEKNYSISFPMFQEAQLYRAYIHKLINNKPKDEDSEISRLLDNDPYEYQSIYFPLDVGQQFVGWTEILSWCDEVSEMFSSHRAQVLLSFCRYKSGDFEMANSLIDEGLKVEENNPLFLALSAMYNYELNKKNEFLDKLETSLKWNNKLPSPYALPFVLKLHHCLREVDKDCMREYQDKLQKVHPNSILALHVEAEVNFLDKTYNKSRKIAEIALEQFPQYKPVLSLMSNLDAYAQ